MKIHRLRLVNFRQHARTEVVFESGITAIIGPNGSGKTTILEAIAWALYGQPAIRGQRDGIRFLGAGSRAPVEVELDFELGGHRYRVTRGLTTAAVYLDGADTAVANSISGTNELLQRRLGMTRTEFFNTYFTGQKDLAVMAAMGPTDRAQFLSRVLGYERLRAAQELAREQRRLIGAELVGLRAGLADADAIARTEADAAAAVRAAVARSNEAGTLHAAAIAELKQVAPAWEQAQRERESWQRLLAEITIVERELERLSRETRRIEAELATLAGVHDELVRLQAAVAPLSGLRQELARLDETFRQEGRRNALRETATSLADDLQRLRERVARVEHAPAAEAALAAQLELLRAEGESVARELEARRTEWVRDRQEAETKLHELRRQYADVKNQRERVTELGPDGACPTCSRVLGESFRSVVDQLTEQLETLQVDGQYFRDRGEQLAAPPAELAVMDERRRSLAAEATQLERRLAKTHAAAQELPQLQQELASKEARLRDLEREIGSISAAYDAGRHRAVRAEIERLTPLAMQVARLEASAERVPVAQQEQQRVAAETAAAAARRAALQSQGATVEFSEERYAGIRVQFTAASDAVRTAELAVVGAQGDVRAAQQQLDAAVAARREYDRVAERMRALNADRAVHDELDRAFQELRADLNDQLRPELAEIASSFLSDLTDDRYAQLELDDKYDVIVLEDGVAKPVISGGEEDLANLVLRLAISQMIADRSGQPFSLLVLDEVFGSLDASRRDNVLDLLRRLEDRFEQVILITHIESVREGVDRVLLVRYDEETGSSRVEGGADEIPSIAVIEQEVVELA